MPDLYLGLISGTSLDAIDAAVVDFSGTPHVTAARSYPLEDDLRRGALDAMAGGGQVSLAQLGELDHRFAIAFSEAARRLLSDHDIAADDISAIGSHGQTIWHAPEGDHPSTLQIGDPSLLAALSGIPVVADFRRKDMAVGGQGAPLASGWHREIFSHLAPVAIINLGGIANITLLESDATKGFDTGPANGLMDAWAYKHGKGSFDADGEFASDGEFIPALLDRLLADPYFALPPPKSTGKEVFNLSWLDAFLEGSERSADVQATLCELTARTVADAINASKARHAILMGGGVHNPLLRERLAANLSIATLETADQHGFDPDFIEAACFAWLARQRLAEQPGNVPDVTGAASETVLGGIYLP
ncbi:MAG: anhydro-N-acetylmuramic acid kinase [Gammaproteobacteria bacterium]|nr:anhydro-N-acetylmuramic acid kinase [Gammaproteobacteria bacterium]